MRGVKRVFKRFIENNEIVIAWSIIILLCFVFWFTLIYIFTLL